MSEILGQMKLRLDENAVDRAQNLKKFGVEKVTRRAALGELQNRQIRGIVPDKDAAAKEIKDIKAVKPRVDTHWKKGSLPTISTTGTSVVLSKPTRAAAVLQAQKPVTRTNSLRSAANVKVTVSSTTVNVQRQRNAIEQTKTLATKVVENKVQQVKIDKVLPAEARIRREDSNISRKSLTKLKAVLNKATIDAVAAASKTASSIVAEKVAKAEPQLVKAKVVDNVVVQSTKTELRIVDVKSHSTTLIEGVRNIDEGDGESLILVSEYVNEIYDYLFELELKHSIREQHLSNQTVVTPKMRAVLLDWIHEVHAQFHLFTETFHITVNIIDRYLQAVSDTPRTRLQLVGVTALFIAAKYEELYPPAICDFIYMTDHSYTQQQLLEMELQIFRALDCNLSRPVSIHFLRRFSKAADVDDEQHAMSKYFLELAAIDYDLAHYRPSEIAAASLFLSLHLFKCNSQMATGFKDNLWNATLKYYSRYDADHLRPITCKIAAIARNAAQAKLNAVYTKYSSPKFYKTALRSVLYSAFMDSIVENK